MKLRKLIGILSITTILTLTACNIKTNAADSSYILGAVNVREDKSAYQISPHGQAKKVWKIVSYPTKDSTIPNYDNAFYCIKADHGFSADGSSTGSKKVYDTKLNMKTQKEEIMTKLNAVNVFSTDKTSYNKILWVIDHMCLPKAEGATATKQSLLEAAGITEYADGVLLTDSDIEAIQQLALWYFTNNDDPNYNSTTLPIMYFNNNSGKDNGYKSFEDTPTAGRTRQYQAEDLYEYFIKNADATYNPEDTTTPVSLEKNNFTSVKESGRYIVGPLKITVDTKRQYDLSELKFMDQNGNEILLTGENKLLNGSKQVVASGNIRDVINQYFYISLPEATTITNVKFSIKGSFNKTEATYYTTNISTYLQEQPVVLVEKVNQKFAGAAETKLQKASFDLSLRKFISEVNGVAPKQSREPIPVLTNLILGTSKTATYNHTKEPLTVKAGAIVTYTIRVYNEAGIDGYVNEITDHLPPNLEFLPDDEDNIENGWVYDEESDNPLRTIKTRHLSKDIDTENLIKAFDGKTLKYKDVKIKCRVKDTAIPNENITNLAQITEFEDVNGNKVDRDSQEKNLSLPLDENLPSYKQEAINRKDAYIPGDQDDDDFEKVKVEVEIPEDTRKFDLALRKFITKVDNQNITNRVPVLSIAENGNIKYTHTKDPLEVKTNNIVTYTLRIYNEGEKSGYAKEITDNLPQGLEYLPENETNKQYRWKMIDKDGSETKDVKKAVKITTDYLSKEQEKTTGANLIGAYNKDTGITNQNPSYKDIQVVFKVIEPNTSDRILTNTAEISKDADSEGNEVNDIDSTPGNNVPNEDDIDVEHVKLVYFDLALRKFITKVDNQNITNRIPVLSIAENGNIKYTHTKEPVEVQQNNIVTYTLRIYNEGKISGYASEITDNLPEGLEFLPENETNKQYRWKMIDKDGNETNDMKNAVKITTDYLSKEQETTQNANLIKAFNKATGITNQNPDYRDIQVAFKVIEPNSSNRILTNTAEISEDTDSRGNKVDDIDSTPGNNVQNEDDIDVEHVKLKQFDLALRKFITKVDNQNIINRIPVLSIGENGNIKYTHTKDPVEVQQSNIVTYTLRIYNEGTVSGYASEITDNLPEGLEFLPEDETNKQYRWKMMDSEGNATNDVKNAVKITTDYLSKEQETTQNANLIKAFNKTTGITNQNPDYRDIQVAFKVIEPNSSNRILTNTAEISEDTDSRGNKVDDIDSTPGNNVQNEDDIDVEHVKLKQFDLALRKFITKVNNLDINNRYPALTMGEDGNIKYTHTKNPVEVESKDTVIYTLRIYNEGTISGYASEITDDIPKGLEFLPENETNKEYRWKMIDTDGNETKDISKAVKVTTDYLSKAQEKEKNQNLIKAFNKSAGLTDKNPDYRDIKIAFKVTESDTSDRIIINTAQISKNTDENNRSVKDIDSTPGNDVPGEDDIDIEKIKLKYFDLALKKWVSTVVIVEDGQKTITQTGHTGYENPEPVVKVDLKAKELDKVTVKFGYKIKVTNEGQIKGYVKQITDYIPDGLKFVEKDNPGWESLSQKEVATDQLKDILLKPGESAEVDILLTWENSENNLGKKINIAEISKDYNESDTKDIDSTPDNRKPGEDDIDDAPVLLSIKTGQIRLYIGLSIVILIILAVGVILIKKYVLDR